jgi:hypothetical protein
MTDPAQMALHTDSTTFVNALLKDAQEDYGDTMFLDDTTSDVSLAEVEDDEALNDLEEIE